MGVYNRWGRIITVGLTALDMSDMARLAELAASPEDATREEIYLAVASLYRVQGAYLGTRERALMSDIMKQLAKDVEMAIRIALAERLADDAMAPHDLILLLVDDAIEVARPIILRNPLLTDEDVLRLIAEFDVPYQEAVAGRPHIGETITEALIRSDVESVLVTLIRNATAKISTDAYSALVDKSRRILAIQEPLARRPDLPPQLATKMCEWVSDALKHYIARNYPVAPERVATALNDAQTAVTSAPATGGSTDGAQRLIEKLAASGQLKAGFLLRVLHQGQADLFDLALARMLEIPLLVLRQRFYEGGPKSVALACRAVGIDRCVFNTVYTLSRRARGMNPNVSPFEMAEVDAAFNSHTRPAALAKLKAA